MNTIKTVGVIAFIVLAYGIVGQMDYEDAVKEEQRYCDMVRDGHWPHYNRDIDCKIVRGIKL